MGVKISTYGKRKKIKVTISVSQDTKPNTRKNAYRMTRNIATQEMKKNVKQSTFKGVRSFQEENMSESVRL